MHEPSPLDALAMLAALDDPVRRRLYRYVRGRGRPVTREEAAADAGISRKLAAFHLDKLVDVGLLRARYEAPPDRRSRVGRAPKVYQPSAAEVRVSIPERRYDLLAEVRVSIPERRYDLLAEVLVDALGRADPSGAAERAARQAAGARGRDLGGHIRQERRLGRPGAERTMRAAGEALDQLGFETVADGQGSLLLRNCPFQALARQAPELVCGINHAFVDGLVRGLGNQTVQVLLAPRPDGCCVELHSARPDA